MYSSLSRSFKKRFPFRLSVPSFIYPANYATNVELLGPFVDEIELLLFESHEASLPTLEEIDRLASLAQALQISYNVHLPIDLDLGTHLQAPRRHAVARLKAILDLVRPLKPTTHTLHLACDQKGDSPKRIDHWQGRTHDSLTALLQCTTVGADRISIETLSYPPAWFAPLVTSLDLAVCFDVGHLVRYGHDPQSVLTLFGPRISICHLHGVDRDKDHLALSHLASRHKKMLRRFLQPFRGSVSVEVFSFERLDASLSNLALMLDDEEIHGPI